MREERITMRSSKLCETISHVRMLKKKIHAKDSVNRVEDIVEGIQKVMRYFRKTGI
jgi:hypothetical protein